MTSTPEATWTNPFPTPVTNKTTYLAGFQYKDNKLEFFPHAEGYVKYDKNQYSYVFNYTDHLGNIRVSYSDIDKNGILGNEYIQECPKQIGSTPPPCQDLYVSAILEENHYYPFGLKHTGYNSDNAQPNYNYKYNGKELQTELGLNMYDYGARNYDAALGRWMNIDPLAENSRRWTPYNYAYNNPMCFIDPDGMQAEGTKYVDEELEAKIRKASREWFEKRKNPITELYGKISNFIGLGEYLTNKEFDAKYNNTIEILIWDKTSDKDVGHTAIRINGIVYGYYPTDQDGNGVYDKNDLNNSLGELHIDSKSNFRTNYLSNTVTSFGIKVTSAQKKALLNELNTIHKNPGQYSLTGNQCTSITVELMGNAGIRLKTVTGGVGGPFNLISPSGLKQSLNRVYEKQNIIIKNRTYFTVK